MGKDKRSNNIDYRNESLVENISDNITLYALWEKVESSIKYYKITFDANNGLGQKHRLYTFNRR